MTAVPLPISIVREDGRVERLGEWIHEERRLVLERPGFPLLEPGDHRLEGELPWIFWDMCPDGYLGRRLAQRNPSLALPPDPRRWQASDVLRALTLVGADLAGNLLIGDESVRGFEAWHFDAREVGVLLAETLRDALTVGGASSLGGERPKLLGSTADGRAYLLKFSPPPTSPQGVRWSDLLRMEAHCARVLTACGVSTSRSQVAFVSGRTTLQVDRYDRLRGRGRAGAATLFWLAMDRWGDVSLPAPEVMRRLEVEGLVSAADAETCARVHAFSAAIGNTDAHLGNYGLLFDAGGRARLAPIFDVLPMVFAPRHDELPDEHVVPRTTPVDERVASWLDKLADEAMADEAINEAFLETWLRHVGRFPG